MDDDKAKREGRHTKLTDSVIDKIAEALRDGNTRKAAANSANVSYETFRQWMIKGTEDDAARKDDSPETQTLLIDLLYEVEFAESHAERYMVELVKKGATTDPKLALEWLARRRKRDWSTRSEVTGADGDPIRHTVNLSNLSDDELEQLAMIRAKIDATPDHGGNPG